MKTKAAIFSPIGVIGIGFLTALLFSQVLNEWAFIPLSLVYWCATFLISAKTLGKEGIASLFKKPQGKAGWPVLSIIVGLIPLSILIMNRDLITDPLVITLWIAFAIINPFFEQIFWRGYLMQELPFTTAGKVIYSTLLFVASHPLMWGLFSIANRSWMTLVSLSVMGIVWCVVYLKTKSLRWCYISHVMVDIFNLSVFVFLNIYIPSAL